MTTSRELVLEDLAGLLAEELRLAHPSKQGIDFKQGPHGVQAEQLLRLQHERDILACINALTECGINLPVEKFLSLCKDPVEFELEPRSK